MPIYSFRRLNDDDFEDAYRIVVEVTQWLLSKGVRQWAEPFPALLYAQRQVLGENFGLYVDNQLASVVSLIDDRPKYWAEHLPKSRFKWLATLATSRQYKGQKLGELTMVEAEQFLSREGVPAVYLDCIFGDGTLPVFYTSLGYKLIARKDITFPHGTFDSVLLRKRLNRR